MKRISLNEVAQKAKVSPTTVSFVLNNAPGKHIPEETRRRVLEVASSLNYVIDSRGKKNAKATRKNVGIVIYHTQSIFSDAYVLRFLEGLGPVFNKNRYRAQLFPLSSVSENFDVFIDKNDLSGLMLMNLHQADLAALHAKKLPFVLIGEVSDQTVPQIDIDNRAAAQTVVNYLLKLGHRRIAMIVHAPVSYHMAYERLEGYRSALRAMGLAPSAENIVVGNFTEESGYLAAKQLLAQSPRPTAIFASNDPVAYGVLRAVNDLGLRVPTDISIAGFDDDYPSRFLVPPLTSLIVPANAIAEKAAQMLVDLMEGKSLVQVCVTVPTTLSIRDSTAEPPR